MTHIIIEQTNSFEDSPNATLRFDHGAAHPITVTPPFSPAQEDRLRWYFEEHLRFPFTHQVRAAEAASSVAGYGEALFEQVFRADANIYRDYQGAAQQGLQSIHIDIIGQPAFHQLHWEALREPGRDPFVLHGAMVRRAQARMPVTIDVQPAAAINLLIVTSRPHGRRDVGYRTISRPLIEGLRQVQAPVRIDIVRPGTYRALVEHLRAARRQHGVGYYHIIHFDLHGSVLTYDQLTRIGALDTHTYKAVLTDRYARPNLAPPPADAPDVPNAYLFFEAEASNDLDPAEARELAGLLREFQIPIAILNACQSGQQIGDTETSLGSHLLQAGIQTVLAMGYSVTVSAAALMMQRFYQSLLSQHNLLVAFGEARVALHYDKRRRAHFNQQITLEDWLLPIVYQPQGDIPAELPLRPMSLADRAALLTQPRNRYHAPEPSYGFVGRDVDILQIEKRVLSEAEGKRRNLLLIRGMGGAGKTALLSHVGQWWQTTGLVDEVFYFGYDVKAYTRDEIIREMGRQLLNQIVPPGMAVSPDFRDYQSLLPEVQQQVLAERLRAERHLLILDNLESITQASLAIPNTLPETERQLLRGLLADLLGGQTLVLLGSRGREGWLTGGAGAPLREADVYDLPGLDDEAASTLAERILARQVQDGAKQADYRQRDAFGQLLKLLDGYPLPLEVVLANLAHQAPEDIVTALQQGDMTLDREADAASLEARTQSLIRCIEYSHSNLDEAAQKLLLCLFPFTGVVWQDQLTPYIEHLRQQDALGDWPFDRWPEVLQTAQDWGLLIAHEQLNGFLHLQPTFPYFLKTRLEKETQAVRHAIETAFRQFYDGLGKVINALLSSKEAQERQIGAILAQSEYENLMTALFFALDDQVSITALYPTLSSYLDTIKANRLGLTLGERVLPRLQDYPLESLRGQIGAELAAVVNNIANRQLHLRQYEQAETSYREALRLLSLQVALEHETEEKMKASIYHNLGMVAQGQRQWQQAEQHYQQALDIKIEFNDRYEQARTYHQLGRVAQEQRQWQQAEQHYQQALDIKIEFNDRYSQASTYHQLGRVAQEQRQWQQAEQHYQQALDIYIEFNDRYSQAGTYHNLGIVAQEQRQWQQAEQHYQQALDIKIEFNDRYEQARTYHQLGIVAQEQRQWQQAEQHYQQALDIDIEFNDRYEQARTYHQLGRVAQEQRQWQQAEQHYQQALDIDIEFNDRYSQAGTYHNLGIVAQEQRQWQQAEQHYQQALDIKIEFNDRYSQASTYHQLGRVAQKQRQWQQAEQHYQQALDIQIEFNDRYEQASTYHQLGSVAQEQRQWETARDFLLKALNITLEFNDEDGRAMTLRSLARLWQASADRALPALVAERLQSAPEETEALLSSLIQEESG